MMQNQVQNTKMINNLKFHVQIQNTDMNENHTANIINILEHLMLRFLINIIMKFETVYYNISESMKELFL